MPDKKHQSHAHSGNPIAVVRCRLRDQLSDQLSPWSTRIARSFHLRFTWSEPPSLASLGDLIREPGTFSFPFFRFRNNIARGKRLLTVASRRNFHPGLIHPHSGLPPMCNAARDEARRERKRKRETTVSRHLSSFPPRQCVRSQIDQRPSRVVRAFIDPGGDTST